MSVVLVTGASGFVGSAIVRQLVRGRARFADGTQVENVVALVRPDGSTERLDELARDGSWSIERADVADAEGLSRILGRVRPRAIIHAALDRDAYLVEDEVRLVTRPLTTMLDWLGEMRDARFLHVGSAWTLAAGDRLDESATVAPTTPYGRNKARADVLVAQLAAERRIAWINLRLFNMFGRYEKPDRLLPTLVAKLSRGVPAELTHGEQIRDFNDVDTMARAFVDALGVPEDACSRVYHIGSGHGTTVRDFAFMVVTSVGGAGRLRFGVASAEDETLSCLVADPSLARRMLGWQPDADLAAAVQDAVAWWLARLDAKTPADVRA